MQAPQARDSANSVAFQDEIGEDASGPDITAITVSNDARDVVTFRIAIPNRPSFTKEMRVGIRVDSGADPAAHNARGDYVLERDDRGLHLFRCSNPPVCDGYVQQEDSSLQFAYARGATFTIDTADLGGTKRFAFAVDAWDGLVFGSDDFTNVHWDFAPDHNQWWTYDTRRVLVETFSATPARPRAGEEFTLHLTAIHTATGTPVAKGKVRCAARIAGKPLKPRSGGLVGERARCVFEIPANARGRRFRATIAIVAEGSRLVRSLSGRVR